MNKNNRELLESLNDKLDLGIPKQEIGKFRLNVALLSLLRFAEDMNRIGLPALTAENNSLVGIYEFRKHIQDALQFSIPWIYEYASRPSSEFVPSQEGSSYGFARRLYDVAKDYSHVWDCMSMLFKGWAIATELSLEKVVYEMPSEFIGHMEVVDNLVTSHNSVYSMPKMLPSEDDISSMLNEANPRTVFGDKVLYTFPEQGFSRTHAIVCSLTENLWHLPVSMELGGYTLGDYRKFWNALLAITMVNEFCCFYSGTPGVGVNSVVMVKKREEWISLLSKCAELSPETVGNVLTDLTFNISISSKSDKLDPTYQPFFPIGNKMIALSSFLAMSSSAERNLWDLLSVIKPELHSTLSNEKEDVWLEDIRRELRANNVLHTNRQIQFQGNESGDIDMIIFDHSNKFALVCEAKYPIAPDRIRDSRNVCDELKKGISQCEKILRWLPTGLQRISDESGIPLDELNGFEFRAAVLSQNSMGGGRVHDSEIPIIPGPVTKWILGTPHKGNARDLWIVGKEFRYAPKVDLHYRQGNESFEFAGVSFKGINTGAQSLRTWDPLTDIDLNSA